MKRCTQHDLQRMYEAPPQELTDRIQETIFSLPVREQEEKIVKKKLSLGAVIAVALLIALMATALAGATNEAFNTYLYQLWPEAARTLMPVDLTCEDKGIRMEVTSASVQDSRVLISYTLQDLEGDRLVPYSYEFYPSVYFGSNPVLSHTGTEQYDEAERKVYYAEYAEYDMSGRNRNNSKYLTLKVELYGNHEPHSAELYPYLKESGSQVQMCPVPDGTLVQPYSGSGDYTVFSDSGLPESLQVIDSSTGHEIPLFESVCLSGIKVIDGMMHIQLHIPGNDFISYENGSYQPYHCDIDLYNDEGYLLPFVDDSIYENMHVLSWGRKINRSWYLPEWMEFIFPVNAETIDKVCSVPIRIDKVLPPIDASLSVKIPVRLISGKE